jgi:hypothetical protein
MSLIRLAKVPEPEVGVLLDVPEQLDRGHLELGHRVLTLEQGGGHGEEPLDLAVHDDGVEAFLTAEVLVDHRLRDAGLGGDLLDRGAVQAALGEQAPPDVQ